MPPPSPPRHTHDVLRYPWLLLGGAVAVLAGLSSAGFVAGLTISVLEAALYGAAAGAAAGALTTKRRLRGAVVGVVACVGITLGIVGYVAARDRLLPSDTLWSFEFVVGALVGVVPGALLWKRWFKTAHAAFQPRAR